MLDLIDHATNLRRVVVNDLLRKPFDTQSFDRRFLVLRPTDSAPFLCYCKFHKAINPMRGAIQRAHRVPGLPFQGCATEQGLQ